MISIIISTYNNEDTIGECLSSIMSQGYEDYEIIVVDGDSTDKTRNICEQYGVKLIGLKVKSNPAIKRNIGVKESKGDIICFIDSDCILEEHYIPNLLRIFKLTNADAISGMTLIYPNQNLIGYLTGLEYEDRFFYMKDGFVSVAATTCLSVRREPFEKLGGFNEIFKEKAVGEDWDFSARLNQIGYKIYHSNSIKVFHDTSTNLPRYLISQFYHAFYRPIHAKKYGKLSDEYSSFIVQSIGLLNAHCVSRIYRRTKELKALALIPLSLVRSFAWILGTFIGIFSVSR